MSSVIASKPWALAGPIQICPGFVYGRRYPSILFTTRVAVVSKFDREKVETLLSQIIGTNQDRGLSRRPDEAPEKFALRWFLGMAGNLTGSAGLPVADNAICYRMSGDMAYCALPTLMGSVSPLFNMLTHLLQLVQAPSAPIAVESARQSFRELQESVPGGSNAPRFIRAAMETGVCVQELPGGAMQFGLGSKAVWMDGTVSQFTPALSVRMARDKVVTSQLLARLRMPVAEHRVVSDVDAALRSAAEIGYPVVLKPCDLDGGVGVQADLRSVEEVRAAFEAARAHSARIMVEKHFEGRDHRLTVFRGDMIWAIERQPACVFGNGKQSIAELVAAENTNPARGIGSHAALKALVLDDEALGLLARDGLTVQHVPEAGQIIRLRRRANIASGGMPVGVTDLVHPDNADLACRAAAILQLDVAGVDLLIPDISKSWRESGAIICEVNAGPELGGTTSLHVYPEILRQMLGGNGNIPVIAFLGDERADRLARQVADAVMQDGWKVGLHVRDGVKLSGKWVEAGPVSCYDAGFILAADRSVEVIILAGLDSDLLRTGFPTPYIDLLVLTGGEAGQNPQAQSENASASAAILRMIAPACRAVLKTSDAIVAAPVAAVLQRFGGLCRTVAQDQVEEEVRALVRRDLEMAPAPADRPAG